MRRAISRRKSPHVSAATRGMECEVVAIMFDPATANDLIKPHMPVVGSGGGQFATVDHLEGRDMIKLTRDDAGQHHYIPLAWVTTVDEEVHIDRPNEQAMKEWSTTPPGVG
jgi:hypothetical protein